MFFNDHNPAHFHVKYGGYKAMINIDTLEIIKGNIPRNALKLIIEWAIEHRGKLREDWNLCVQSQQPIEIQTLV